MFFSYKYILYNGRIVYNQQNGYNGFSIYVSRLPYHYT